MNEEQHKAEVDELIKETRFLREEIARLKGLLRKEFEKSFRFPKRVNMDSEWQHYATKNNL